MQELLGPLGGRVPDLRHEGLTCPDVTASSARTCRVEEGRATRQGRGARAVVAGQVTCTRTTVEPPWALGCIARTMDTHPDSSHAQGLGVQLRRIAKCVEDLVHGLHDPLHTQARPCRRSASGTQQVGGSTTASGMRQEVGIDDSKRDPASSDVNMSSTCCLERAVVFLLDSNTLRFRSTTPWQEELRPGLALMQVDRVKSFCGCSSAPVLDITYRGDWSTRHIHGLRVVVRAGGIDATPVCEDHHTGCLLALHDSGETSCTQPGLPMASPMNSSMAPATQDISILTVGCSGEREGSPPTACAAPRPSIRPGWRASGVRAPTV